MNAIADLAAIEAAIAEHELSDEEAALVKDIVRQGGEPDESAAAIVRARSAEPEAPAQAEQPGGEPTDKQWATLGRENERHVKRVRDIMGAAVEGFTECETCSGVGIVPPGPPPPEPQTHEFFKACGTCAGFGEVLTGSLREGQVSRDCPACGGRGYLEALSPDGAPLAGQGSAPPPATPPPPLMAAEVSPAPAGGNGAEPLFGVPSWMGDPNLGA